MEVHTELNNATTWELWLDLLTVLEFWIKEQTKDDKASAFRNHINQNEGKTHKGRIFWSRLYLSWDLQNDREVFQVTKGRGVSHAEEATRSGSEMRMCQAESSHMPLRRSVSGLGVRRPRDESQLWVIPTHFIHPFTVSGQLRDAQSTLIFWHSRCLKNETKKSSKTFPCNIYQRKYHHNNYLKIGFDKNNLLGHCSRRGQEMGHNFKFPWKTFFLQIL